MDALRIGVLFAVLLPGALAPAQDLNPTLPLSDAKAAASKLLAESTCWMLPMLRPPKTRSLSGGTRFRNPKHAVEGGRKPIHRDGTNGRFMR